MLPCAAQPIAILSKAAYGANHWDFVSRTHRLSISRVWGEKNVDLNPIGIAVPFFLVMIVIEALLLRRSTGRWIRLNDAFTDLSCGIGDQMLGLFFKPLVLFPYAFCFEHSLMRLSTTNTWTWVFGLLAVDLCYYFYHRCSHRMNFGWSGHVVHHQSEEYNLSVALRQPWFSSFFSWVFYLPLAIVGLPLEVFATSFAVNLLYQFGFT